MSLYRFQRTYRGRLRAAIYDWAGTTVDFGSRAPVRAVMEVFAARDVPITFAEARGPMGMAKRDHLRTLLELPNVIEAWTKAHGAAPNENDLDALYEKFLPATKRVLPKHADLIPGFLEVFQESRRRGMKTGSSTGYTQELMDILVPLAREQGYEPDAIECADTVSPGRPAPWMCFENARRLGVYPMSAIVKVDDTIVGIEAGLNAGMWTVGVAAAGNLVGLSEKELADLPAAERDALVGAAQNQLYQAGAHFVVNSTAEMLPVFDEINARLARGEAP